MVGNRIKKTVCDVVRVTTGKICVWLRVKVENVFLTVDIGLMFLHALAAAAWGTLCQDRAVQVMR